MHSVGDMRGSGALFCFARVADRGMRASKSF